MVKESELHITSDVNYINIYIHIYIFIYLFIYYIHV